MEEIAWRGGIKADKCDRQFNNRGQLQHALIGQLLKLSDVVNSRRPRVCYEKYVSCIEDIFKASAVRQKYL